MAADGARFTPDQVWWQREQAPEEVVRRSIREEDAHDHRYMWSLARNYSNTWSFIQRVPYHVSYDPVRGPYLWMRSAGGSAPRDSGPVEVSLRGSCMRDVLVILFVTY